MTADSARHRLGCMPAVWVRLCVALALLPVVGAQAGPKISCAESVHEFGRHDASKPVVHTFALRNEGDKRLEIGNVRACCGATASITSKKLAPGEEARVTVKLSLDRRHGPQNKVIWISSNDPNRPLLPLRLKGTPVHDCRFSVRHVGFDIVPRDKPVHRDVTLTWTDRLSPDELTLDFPANAFTAEITERSGSTAAIRVSTVPPLAPGRYHGLLKVTSGNGALKNLTLPVHARVESEFSVTPAQILLTPQSAGRSLKRFLAVRHSRGEAFEITEADTDASGLRAELRRVNDTHWRITVRGTVPENGFPDNQATLTLHLTSDSTPTLDIPIRIVTASGD